MPIRHKSHVQEDLSRRQFEEIIEPWTVPSFTVRDYGIDVTVEFTNPIKDSGNFEMLGKFFNVQLKSQTKVLKNNKFTSIAVDVDKIQYWFNSNVATMIAVYVVKSKKYYYRWINQELINEIEGEDKNWLSQKEKTIRIPYSNDLSDTQNRSAIFSYVLDWKQPSRKIIPPGKYFEFKTTIDTYVSQLQEETTKYNFASTDSLLKTCRSSLDQALYRVAISGPSRAGKSSFINALLNFDNKEVSPVDITQTTAVPIQIFPGTKTSITVFFADNRKEEFDYSENIIKKYATQNQNPDNILGVSLLAIFLPLLKLQYGVSYVDAAGLDDPNDDIISTTLAFVKKCNAIVYIIDASPISDGGFIFRNDFKKHLIDFSTNIEKVFLVFNKSDKANPERLEILKNQVTKDLSKFSLYEKFQGKIYYLSAEKYDSLSHLDKFSRFEEDLWKYILNENKTGFINLYSSIKEIKAVIENIKGLVSLKLGNSDKSAEVSKMIQALKPRVDELAVEYSTKLKSTRQYMFYFVNLKKVESIKYVYEYLSGIPTNKSLPKGEAIKQMLRNDLEVCMRQGNVEYEHQVRAIKSLIDTWIKTHLKEIKKVLNDGVTKVVDFTELELLRIPDIDYSASIGMGITSFLGGLLVNPIVGLFTGLLGFLGSEIFNSESRRKKQIAKIMPEIERAAELSFAKVISAYNSVIDEQTGKIEKYADDHIQSYLNDLEKQISMLGKTLSPTERKSLGDTKVCLEKINKELDSLVLEMKLYYDPS